MLSKLYIFIGQGLKLMIKCVYPKVNVLKSEKIDFSSHILVFEQCTTLNLTFKLIRKCMVFGLYFDIRLCHIEQASSSDMLDTSYYACASVSLQIK